MRVQDQTYQAPSFKSKKAYDAFKGEATLREQKKFGENTNAFRKKGILKENINPSPTGSKHNQAKNWF